MDKEHFCPKCHTFLNLYLQEQGLLNKTLDKSTNQNTCPDCNIEFTNVKKCLNNQNIDYVAKCDTCTKVFALRYPNTDWCLADLNTCPFGHGPIDDACCHGCGFSYTYI